MSNYIWDELGKIASLQKDTPLFSALDKLANVSFGGQAPGYNAVGSEGMNQGGGATTMPGFSTHCDKCFAELPKDAVVCPKCGTPISKKRDMKKEEPRAGEDDSDDDSETGGKAAEREELGGEEDTNMGKTSAAKEKVLRVASPEWYLKAGLGLGVSGYAGLKLHQLTKEPPNLEKRSSRGIGPNPILRVRKSKKFVSSPAASLANWNKRTKRSSAGLVQRTKQVY